MKIVQCNRDCSSCQQLNTKTDKNDIPWGYDCLKYGDSIFNTEFTSTKQFEVEDLIP